MARFVQRLITGFAINEGSQFSNTLVLEHISHINHAGPGLVDLLMHFGQVK